MRLFDALASLRTPAVRWATAGFFAFMTGYSLLRPVREEMGISGGVEQLPWMYTGTFIAMLITIVPVSWAVGRWRRTIVVPVVYAVFAVSLVAIFGAVRGADPERTVVLARVLYIWISTFNLFAVSLFWALMADVSTHDESKRTFGIVAAGGSAGAIAGPSLTAALAETLGPFSLLLLGSGAIVLAAACAVAVARSTTGPRGEPQPLGGPILEGIVRIARSRQLLGICAYIVLFTTTSTFLYFEQAHIVEAAIADPGARTKLFAQIDLSVNVLSLVGQAAVVAALLRRLGLGWVLAILPVLSVIGFAGLAFAPVLVVLVIVQVLRRATNFALAKPAREVLFTAVDRTERYKSKLVIDTVVYRGSDAVAAWAFAGLGALGLGLAGIAAVGVPLSIAWTFVARALGRGADATVHGKQTSGSDAPG